MAAATSELPLAPRVRLARLAGELRRPDFVAWRFGLLAAWWLAFGALVLRAWVHAGVWPHGRRGNPITGNLGAASVDPQSFGLHHVVVWALTFVSVYVVPFALVAFLVRLPFARHRPSPEMRLAFPALALSAMALVLLDLGGLFTWFLD